MTKASEANRRWRESHPLEYCYITLRDNARRRHKEFSLTLEQFREFCYKTKYIKKKGITRDCYTIDREKNEFGYHIWNIKILKNKDNAAKGCKAVEFTCDPDNPFKVKTFNYAV